MPVRRSILWPREREDRDSADGVGVARRAEGYKRREEMVVTFMMTRIEPGDSLDMFLREFESI